AAARPAAGTRVRPAGLPERARARARRCADRRGRSVPHRTLRARALTMTDAKLRPCDVLAVGAHPDDVEIAAAGTLLLLAAAGRTISIVDVTRGEKGSRGTAADRAEEAAAAAARLGVLERHNL